MFPLITTFFMKYWKQFTVGAMIALVLFFTYYKGRKDYALKIEKQTREELEKRHDSVDRERNRTDKIRDSIRRDREAFPEDDERDSCLLSNDPYSVNCIKGEKK